MKRKSIAFFLVAMMALSQTLAFAGETASSKASTVAMNDGVYSSEARAYGGNITVNVSVENNAISAITVDENNETKNVGGTAIEMLKDRIINNQSPNVDVVSGATLTSIGFINAVKEALKQSGANIANFPKATDSEDMVKNEYAAEVVVVGGGLSGLATAARAAEGGKSVILLEKQSFLGGCSHMSLGSFMVAEVETNKGYYITDEADTMAAALERWHKKMDEGDNLYPDYSRVEHMLTQSMFTLDWLKTQGVFFSPKAPIADRGMAMVQGDADAGIVGATQSSHIIAKLADNAKANGATILLDTRAEELILDDGTVTGVIAKHKGTSITIKAESVVLASGGFAANRELQAKLMPNSPEFFTITASGNTGDGIIMAEKAGAAIFEDNWLQPAWPGPSNEFYYANPDAKFIVEVSSPIKVAESTYDRLMVDKDGKRFMNEAQPYGNQQVIMVDHKGSPYWSIYSNLSDDALAIFESGLRTGKVVKADSIEELAKAMGIEPKQLQDTTLRYDEMVAAGTDSDYGKIPERLKKPVGAKGPFIAVQVLPGSVDSFGGVITNINQQALNEQGDVVPGLYAVGAMANRLFYNRNYLSGSQLTFAASTGKLAAEHILGIAK